MSPLTVFCLLAVFLLSAAPISTLKLAITTEVEREIENQSNSTSGMFSLTENINRITGSVKQLYALAFKSSNSTGVSNKVLGAKCEKLGDCSTVEFATCDNGICTCDNNHTVSTEQNDTCMKVVSNKVLGAKCEKLGDCSTVEFATCDNNGICNCDTNHTVSTEQNDKCIKGVSLGEGCQEDVQCQKEDSGSVCVLFNCICSIDNFEKEGKCIPKTKLGFSCKENEDCRPIPFVECIDNVCACPEPYLPGKHLNVCLSVASPDERASCEEDIQCTAQYGDKSRCISGFCECDHSYHAFIGKCIPDLQLGSPCNKSLECIVSRQTEEGIIRECFNSTCTCAVGYKSSNEENLCVKAGKGYQLHASLAWLFCIFVIPYLF